MTPPFSPQRERERKSANSNKVEGGGRRKFLVETSWSLMTWAEKEGESLPTAKNGKQEGRLKIESSLSARFDFKESKEVERSLTTCTTYWYQQKRTGRIFRTQQSITERGSTFHPVELNFRKFPSGTKFACCYMRRPQSVKRETPTTVKIGAVSRPCLRRQSCQPFCHFGI